MTAAKLNVMMAHTISEQGIQMDSLAVFECTSHLHDTHLLHAGYVRIRYNVSR